MESADLLTVAQAIAQKETTEMDGKYLTFWTDEQLFGIPIAFVVQIVEMQTITSIPEFPYYAKGIINLRGSIIPLIDIRLRLGKQEAPYNERTCIIVADINNSNIGFIVDEVDAVVAIAEELIAPPPQLSSGVDGYITGIGKLEQTMVLLMDTCKVIGEEDCRLLINS